MIQHGTPWEALWSATRRQLPAWGAALIIVFVAGLCLGGVPVRFRGADDVWTITCMAAPYGWSDPYNPYLSQIAGFLLAGLYRISPNIPWYGVTLFVAMGLGWWLLLWSVFATQRRWWLLLSLFLLLPMIFWAFAAITYTESALYLELGCFVALMRLPTFESESSARRFAFGIAIALVFACAIRWKLALMLMVLFPFVWFSRSQRKILLSVLIVVGAFFAVDRVVFYATATQQVQRYMEFSAVRAALVDTFPMQPLHPKAQALQEAGWAQADAMAYQRWVFLDHRTFTPARMRRFLAYNRIEGLHAQLLRRLQNVRDFVLMYSEFFTLWALACLWFGVALFTMRRQLSRAFLWRFALWAMPWGGLVLYLLSWRFVERLAFPLFAYFVCGFLVLLAIVPAFQTANDSTQEQDETPRFFKMFASVLVVLGLSIGIFDISLRLRGLYVQRAQHIQTDQIFAQIRKDHPSLQWMIPMEDSVENVQLFHPLRDQRGVRSLRVFPLGALTYTPFYFRTLASMGLSDGLSLLRHSIDNPQLLFLSTKEAFLPSFWQSYLNHLQLIPGRVQLVRRKRYKTPQVELHLFQAVRAKPVSHPVRNKRPKAGNPRH